MLCYALFFSEYAPPGTKVPHIILHPVTIQSVSGIKLLMLQDMSPSPEAHMSDVFQFASPRPYTKAHCCSSTLAC